MRIQIEDIPWTGTLALRCVVYTAPTAEIALAARAELRRREAEGRCGGEYR